MHLLLRPIFPANPNFINVRTAYASKSTQLTKNLLAKSSTKRFRELPYIFQGGCGETFHLSYRDKIYYIRKIKGKAKGYYFPGIPVL